MGAFPITARAMFLPNGMTSSIAGVIEKRKRWAGEEEEEVMRKVEQMATFTLGSLELQQ